MEKRNILLQLAYDGKNYNGWQKQKNAKSIQAVIENALSEILGERVILIGAGRTDAKAHAINYTANFHTHNFSIPAEKFKHILNSKLPPDIFVIDSREVSHTFHSRFSAKAREYVYIVLNSPSILPHLRDYVYNLPERINIEKLREITNMFTGRHNFKNFSIGYENEDKNLERIIYYFRVGEVFFLNQRLIIFFIKGNGFLKGMIRCLISVCLNYEAGILKRECIDSALKNETHLESKYRVPVPASGLYFKRAFYDSKL
ncbi:MAG: tRNA pseudouridine(38-40) synthase TruA [Brevinematia bacterium]